MAQGTVRQRVRWTIDHGLPGLAMRKAADAGDVQGRLLMGATPGADLRPFYADIRAQGPVALGKTGGITVSHAAAREVLSSNAFITGRFGRDDSLIGKIGRWSARDVLHPVEAPSLLAVDPPEHTRYRKLVTRVFTVKAVEQLRGRIQQIADELLDGLDPSQPVDLVERYCGLLPVTVISVILGVPLDERDYVLALGGAAGPSLDFGLPWRQFRGVESALAEFDDWLGAHLRNLADHPGDDLLSQLVMARDQGEGLTERELRSTAGLVLAAGFETTVNLLGNGIALLSGNPDQLGVLRDDPSLWPNAVSEVLRYDSPVLLTGRQATQDVEIAGTPVPADTRIVTVLAGANRDPEVFDDPDTFDVTRANAEDHLAFGAGRHYCLGASLARMEGEIGLRSVFERFPDLKVLPGAERRTTRILRGYEHLPVALS